MIHSTFRSRAADPSEDRCGYPVRLASSATAQILPGIVSCPDITATYSQLDDFKRSAKSAGKRDR